MTSLAEALPAQIKRVSEKKARWEGYMRDGLLGPLAGLSVKIMQAEIEQAIANLASGDVLAIMQSHANLAAYNEDD